MPEVYPSADALPAFDPALLAGLDWTVCPANTALSWFGDPAFTAEYTDRAIALMRSAARADNTLTYMVFAEQRLLAMLAQEKGVRLDALSSLAELFGGAQRTYTHVWGFKQQMREIPPLYEDFCRRCAARLTREFPAESTPLRAIPALAHWFDGL